MNIYETIWMLAAIEELPLEHTFFKSRYFPTDDMMDVFNTSKVLADYREGKRKKAPFVVPRIGSLPVGREGFKTYELEPAYIGLSMPLTIDQLNKRGFGESIMSGMTPEERAKHLQLHDMEELSEEALDAWQEFQEGSWEYVETEIDQRLEEIGEEIAETERKTGELYQSDPENALIGNVRIGNAIEKRKALEKRRRPCGRKSICYTCKSI